MRAPGERRAALPPRLAGLVAAIQNGAGGPGGRIYETLLTSCRAELEAPNSKPPAVCRPCFERWQRRGDHAAHLWCGHTRSTAKIGPRGWMIRRWPA